MPRSTYTPEMALPLGAALRRAALIASHAGLHSAQALRAISGLPAYVRDLFAYAAERDRRFPLRIHGLLPVFGDRKAHAGTQGAYFHQDLWAARRIFAKRPSRHVDIGSRIDGFIAHLLTFMPVEVVDIRPLASPVEGLTFTRDDATTLHQFADGSVESLSALHVVEHFGLGRYGDSIRANGWLEAMLALQRVLAPGGTLYFSVPIGRERLRFNAHRIFSPRTVLEVFSELELVAFSAVNDRGELVSECDPMQFTSATYSVGFFELTKDAAGWKRNGISGESSGSRQ